jgi:hypothetical protein
VQVSEIDTTIASSGEIKTPLPLKTPVVVSSQASEACEGYTGNWPFATARTEMKSDAVFFQFNMINSYYFTVLLCKNGSVYVGVGGLDLVGGFEV